jgi:hypothetical protein
MRRVSLKRAKLERERAKLNAELRTYPRRCEFPLGCTQMADAWHEYVTRGQGGSIVDPENLRASCNFHNGYAEDHINECHDIGWRYSKKHAAELAIGDAA